VVEYLISVYSSPLKDDLVLLFKVKIIEQYPWEPNEEIEKVDFFKRMNYQLYYILGTLRELMMPSPINVVTSIF
jgi:hypothetical protein